MDNEIEALIPHANFRWVNRFMPAPHYGPGVSTKEKFLQQAFSRPGASGVIWRDVPVVDDHGDG